MDLADTQPYIFGLIAIVFGLAVTLSVARAALALGFPLPSNDATGRYGHVDGLRGYLALAVMVAHCSGYVRISLHGEIWSAAKPPVMIANLGVAGVSLFFMLTGFLFYWKIRNGIRGWAWIELFTKRLFRLYPAALLSIAAVVAIILARTNFQVAWQAAEIVNLAKWVSFKAEPDLFGYHNSFMVNGAVLWSLWYEMLFYFVIMPGISLLAFALRGTVPLLPIVAAIWLVSSALGAFGFSNLYLPLFTMGMLVFELVERDDAKCLMRTSAAGVLAMAAVLVGLALPSHGAIQAILFAPLLACAAAGNSFWGAFSARPSVVLGECSYSIYLFHMIVLSVVLVDLRGPLRIEGYGDLLIGFVASAGLVASLSAAVFLLIEKPMMQRGAQIAAKLTGRWRRKQPDLTDSVAP